MLRWFPVGKEMYQRTPDRALKSKKSYVPNSKLLYNSVTVALIKGWSFSEKRQLKEICQLPTNEKTSANPNDTKSSIYKPFPYTFGHFKIRQYMTAQKQSTK